MRAHVAVVAGIVGVSLACGGGTAAVPPAPAPEVSAPSPAPVPVSATPDAPVRGKRKNGGPRGDQCATDQAEFATKAGKVKGLRAAVKALDTTAHGTDTRYELAPGAKIPCKVDLSRAEFFGVVDTVGLTSDGRGLLFSSGTSDVRGIDIFDLEAGGVWAASSSVPIRVEGDAFVVRKLGETVPRERPWPAGCDEALKSQMSCILWEEIRWQGGRVTPTGTSGGTISQ